MRGRGDRLEARLRALELERMLVTDLVNVRYLTGFTGTNGACVCGAGLRLFFTDFRYTERAEGEVEGWEIVTVSGDWLGEIAAHLSGRVGFEDDQVSVRMLEKLKAKLAEGVEPVAAGGTVEELRRVKDEIELAAIAEAAKLADSVWEWTIERGFAGRTEREVAGAAEARMLELGSAASFPAIVAAGSNSALPHAGPGQHQIGRGEFIVFDMGAKVDGYCSDGTRTFATGEPGEEARAVYEVVREAQAASLRAVVPGAKGEDVDTVAREIIAAAGHGDRFGHGLGHGVGLVLHEGPRLTQKSDDVLEPGEVVTVEPGIYLPGKFGVRIEDLVTVTEDGYRNFSGLSKELTIVD
ncbi:MAG TPA: aminopeptidase P family protein [Solirubrobacterales bacterium]|nr:aminopeptidase P family protein [Solirubrobacterales bacterium]